MTKGNGVVPPAGSQGKSPTAAAAERIAEWREARAISALAALYALLEVAVFAAFAWIPSVESTPSQIGAFKEWDGAPIVARLAVILMPFVAVVFLWWTAALRGWLLGHGRSVNRVLADVQLGSGICYITLVFVAAATMGAAVTGRLLGGFDVGPDVEHALALVGRTVLMIYAMRMAAIFTSTTAKLGHEAGVLPTWFVRVSYAVALALFLVPTLDPWVSLVFPAWALLLAAVIHVERTRWARRATRAVAAR